MAVDHYFAIHIWIPSKKVWRVIYRIYFRNKNTTCQHEFFEGAS